MAIVDAMEPSLVLSLAEKMGLSQVIQKSCTEFEQEKICSISMIQNPKNFMLWPTDTILGTEARAIQDLNINFKQSKEKENTIQKVLSWCKNLPRISRRQDSIRLIVDELYTNAIYNAPPSLRKSGQPRTVSKKSVLNAELFLSASNERLLIGTRDRYGTLCLDSLLAKISTSFRDGLSAAINQGPGGAGIGCRLMFDQCLAFYIGVRPRYETIVAFTLPIGRSAQPNEIDFKNIHFCIQKD